MTRTKDDIQREFDRASERALIESIEREHIERLARIDPREVYGNEDTFTDSDEWLERRSYEWVRDLMENETPNRRKEK